MLDDERFARFAPPPEPYLLPYSNHPYSQPSYRSRADPELVRMSHNALPCQLPILLRPDAPPYFYRRHQPYHLMVRGFERPQWSNNNFNNRFPISSSQLNRHCLQRIERMRLFQDTPPGVEGVQRVDYDHLQDEYQLPPVDLVLRTTLGPHREFPRHVTRARRGGGARLISVNGGIPETRHQLERFNPPNRNVMPKHVVKIETYDIPQSTDKTGNNNAKSPVQTDDNHSVVAEEAFSNCENRKTYMDMYKTNVKIEESKSNPEGLLLQSQDEQYEPEHPEISKTSSTDPRTLSLMNELGMTSTSPHFDEEGFYEAFIAVCISHYPTGYGRAIDVAGYGVWFSEDNKSNISQVLNDDRPQNLKAVMIQASADAIKSSKALGHSRIRLNLESDYLNKNVLSWISKFMEDPQAPPSNWDEYKYQIEINALCNSASGMIIKWSYLSENSSRKTNLAKARSLAKGATDAWIRDLKLRSESVGTSA